MNRTLPLLQQAYDLILACRPAQAVEILTLFLQTNPTSAEAWWLLANASADTYTQRLALSRLLALRPGDANAQQMLIRLDCEDTQMGRPSRLPRRGSGIQPVPVSNFQLVNPFAQHAAQPFTPPLPTLEPRSKPVIQRRTGGWYSLQHGTFTMPGSDRSLSVLMVATGLFMMVGLAAIVFTLALSTMIARRNGAVSSVPEPTVHAATPESISYAEWRSGEMRAGEIRSYRFYGLGGHFVVAEVNSNTGTLNPAIMISTADGQRLAARGDDSNSPTSAHVSVTLPAEGWYLISVYGQVGEGRYQLNLRRG